MQVIMNTEFDTKLSEVAKTMAMYTDSYLIIVTIILY